MKRFNTKKPKNTNSSGGWPNKNNSGGWANKNNSSGGKWLKNQKFIRTDASCYTMTPREEELQDECAREMRVFLRAGPCGLNTLSRVWKNIMKHYDINYTMHRTVLLKAGLHIHFGVLKSIHSSRDDEEPESSFA